MTTPYNIKIAPTAERQLLALLPKQQKSIAKVIAALSVNPRPPGTKKIEGLTGLYSQDFQQNRLVYKIEEQEILLLLVK